MIGMVRTLLALLPDGSRRTVLTHALLTAGSVLARAAGALLLIPLVATLFGPTPAQAWRWVAALAAVTAAGWVLDWLCARLGYSLGFALLESGQRTVADLVTRIRLTWFDAENTATARQAIAATGPDLVGVVVYLVTPVASALLAPVVIAVALFPLAPQLAWTALGGVVVLWGAYLGSGRLTRAAERAAAQANGSLTERIVEFARTQPTLRAARRVEPERSQVGAALDAQHGATARLVAMQIPGQLAFSVASQLVLAAMAGVTVWLAVDGSITVPVAVALLVVVVRFLEPFTVLAELGGGVETAAGVLRRIETVLTAPRELEGERTWQASGAVTVELRDVSFGYRPEGPLVLDGLSLTLRAGTTTAIVGPSGSGKSTVLALLAGLHTPTDGAILMDGVDVADLAADSRRDLSSVVFQDPYLFDGTVAENVRAGDPGASEVELAAAAALARVDTILERLPAGWDTPVGEGGSALSGGERQRVSIARALVKPAPLLLVDEATSALDTENEAAVAAALVADPRPRTRVIVAHRLSSIRAADRVVFLEDGQIVEDGTLEGLLAAGGRFAEFWQHSRAATTWRLVEATG